MQLTERHYARWITDGDEYRPALQLAPGDVPADVLARREAEKSCLESCPDVDFDTYSVQENTG
jgi:hypothetical protein